MSLRNQVEALLFAAAPFLAAVAGWIILREEVRRATWVAMLFAIIGIAIMVVNGFATGRIVGNLSALLSAAGFAAFSIALRWGKLEDMLPAVFLAGIFSLLTAALICSTNDFGFAVPRNDIVIAVLLGVFQVGMGLVVYTIGSRVVPAAELAGGARRFSLFALLALLVCSPWMLRNQRELGTLGLRSNLGVELYVGNNDVANGRHQTPYHPSQTAHETERMLASAKPRWCLQ